MHNILLRCAITTLLSLSWGIAACHAASDINALARAADAKYGPLTDLVSTGTTAESFMKRREQLKATVLNYIGPFPAQKCELKPRVLREEKLDGYTRFKVRYLTQPGEDVTAFLLVPDSATSVTPAAAVLACHQTSEPAKEEVCGVTSSPRNMQYGLDLVRRGYVVLAPDSITAGERIYPGYEPFETAAFDRANPNWSAIGKMAWDHMRGIDFLQQQPYVKSDAIGVVGHSLGAYNAFFLAAFDERVRVVIESCGYCTIASDPGRERWARTQWFVHIPRLRPYVEPGSTRKAPFDFHEVLSLVAPRPVFQSVGLQDKIFGTADSAVQVHEQLSPVYKLLGAPANFETFTFNGPHDFPPEAKAAAYAFLEQRLPAHH
jgi:dienelactone hydrolase